MNTLTIICTILSFISFISVIVLYIVIVNKTKQDKLVDNTLEYIVKHL